MISASGDIDEHKWAFIILILTVAVIALSLPTYETSEMVSPLSVCTILASGELETTVSAALSTSDQTASGKSLLLILYSRKLIFKVSNFHC